MEESYFEEDMGKEDIHKKQRRRRTLMFFLVMTPLLKVHLGQGIAQW